MQISYAKDRMKLENDEILAAKDKAEKLAEIDRHLSAIKSYLVPTSAITEQF